MHRIFDKHDNSINRNRGKKNTNELNKKATQ
jgi:hypothetical protein